MRHHAPTRPAALAIILLAACASPGPPAATPSPSAASLPGGIGPPPDAVEVPGEDASVLAAWETPLVGPELYAAYRDALRRAGHRIDLDAPGGGAAILGYTTAEGTFQLEITGDLDGSRVVLRRTAD